MTLDKSCYMRKKITVILYLYAAVTPRSKMHPDDMIDKALCHVKCINHLAIEIHCKMMHMDKAEPHVLFNSLGPHWFCIVETL